MTDIRGFKRVCASCATRFYDFNKSPILCPSCGAEFTGAVKIRTRRGRGVVDEAKARPEEDEVEDIVEDDDDTVSLEDLDEEEAEDIDEDEVDIDADGDLDLDDLDEDDVEDDDFDDLAEDIDIDNDMDDEDK